MDSTYEYTPLNDTKRHIRLLHLQPSDKINPGQNLSGSERDPIICTFSVASLDDNPSYEALSYVLGNADNTASIVLEGHEFLVNSSLESILRHVRKDRERVLWVDALCIDQANLNERSHQVLEMHRIYSQAWCVIAFLGETWKGCDSAINLVDFIASHPDTHWDSASEQSINSHEFDVHSLPLFDSIIRLLASPWWSRVWTVQEFVLAQRVVFMCGHHEVKSDVLVGFAIYCDYHHVLCCPELFKLLSEYTGSMKISKVLDNALGTWQIAKREGKEHDLLSIINMLKLRNCLDPLDKIYGMLGMASDSFRTSILVDYNCSLNEVYMNTTLVASKTNLDFLSFPYEPLHRNMETPTWVPNFPASDDEGEDSLFSVRVASVRFLFRASQDTQPHFAKYESVDAVTSAIVLDSISIIDFTATKTSGSEPNVQRQAVDALKNLLDGYDSSSGPYKSKSEVLWRTLCGGTRGNFDSESWCRPLLHEDDATFKKWSAWFPLSDPHVLQQQDVEVLDFDFAIRMTTIGRRCAVTCKGYIGWIPAKARKGDVVVLIPGGNVPYILRQVHQKSSPLDTVRRYEFVGDAYIHGIMHGEAYDGTKLEPIILV
ncbi:heterokaryon incompatibility protein-domain-containing protein [Boeremia exigua]|uniref:heterokaryon incompatibility protein-domain-containing protein n=1 Tax=Boeremia exigua TaxID=749465 RepID=UPI001E8E34FA|nr:heterokaryon incompatibility protein-domain-containing protein [Boeremia exigua]KAH6638780.1 heterokaryon incompatibility protein-domain-containing protein [Boeremia exigua]